MLRIVLLWSLSALAAHHKAESPTQIIHKGERQLRGESSQMLTSMTIHHRSYVRTLRLRTLSLHQDRSLVEILEPIKEEGTVSLRIENEMWNYLPKTDQVVKVPTSMLLQSWMGSDFTNDDLLKLSSLGEHYSHTFLGDHNKNTVAIECLPKPGAPVVWSKIIHWARRKDSLPVKQEYFDEKNQLIRTLTYSNFSLFDNRIIPSTIRVVQSDTPDEYTEIRYERVLFDRRIPEEQFDRAALKRLSHNGKSTSTGWYTAPLNPSLN